MKSRADGEVTRLVHAIDRCEAILCSLRAMSLSEHEIPGPDVGQSIVMSALEIATTLARLSAYRWAAKP